MQFYPNGLFHLYNRGHNKQAIFFNRENYLYFLKKVRIQLLPYCDILAYCLMPNHFHFLVYTKDIVTENNYQFNNSIGVLLRTYAQAINNQQNRIGALFQEKTKAKDYWEDTKFIQNKDYAAASPLAVAFDYIHQNPVKAKLVESPEQWEFSSYADYNGWREGTLCNQKLYQELAGV